MNCEQTMDSDHEYYEERWSKEHRLDGPPNAMRVDTVANCVRQAVSGRSFPKILDVGCGNGWILKGISEQLSATTELFGIEPSFTGVKNTKVRVPQATVQQGGLGDVVLPSDFDAVVCSEVVEHVNEQDVFVAKLATHIQPGGSLVLTTPNAKYRNTYFKAMGVEPQPVESWITATQLERLMRPHFRSVRVTSFDISFWSKQNPKTHQLLRSLWAVKGGYRCWKLIEWIQLAFKRDGLYLLALATK